MTKPELKEARFLVRWAVNSTQDWMGSLPPDEWPDFRRDIRKLKRVLRKKGLYR